MDMYREQLLLEIKELNDKFEIVKNETVKDITNITPGKATSIASSYSNNVRELHVIAGQINILQQQLRAFDYYNKEN